MEPDGRGNVSKATTGLGPRPVRPDPPRTFLPGPPIRPSTDLLEWLNMHQFKEGAEKEQRRVRLPVVIRHDQRNIVEAFIGVNDTKDGETIFIRPHDDRMGVSLMDLVNQLCPSKSSVCVVWLEGYWGGRSPLDDDLDSIEPTTHSNRWPFQAIRIHERIENRPSTEVPHVQIESAGP